MRLILSLLFYTIMLFGQSIEHLDSLYKSGQYEDFLNSNLTFLKENALYRDDLRNTLKIANAFYRNQDFNKSLKVYSLLSERDSLLSDYYSYYIVQSYFHLKDTLNYLDKINQYINRFGQDYYLSKRLIKNTGYMSFLKEEIVENSDVEDDILKSKLEFDAYRKYIDTIPTEFQLTENYKDKRIIYNVFKKSIEQNELDLADKIIPVYDSISAYDYYSAQLIYYFTNKKEYEKALTRVLKEADGHLPYGYNVDYHRRIPRLFLKLNNKSKAYEAYLDFARKFPNHSFSISAVSYVLGKYEHRDYKKYLKVLKEFSEIKSVYRNYYRFQEILYYYEKRNFKKSLSLIDGYFKKKVSHEFNDKLVYWNAKILFEQGKYDQAITMLESFKDKPFHSYYSLKGVITLNENKKLSLDTLHIDDHTIEIDDTSIFDSLKVDDKSVYRLLLIYHTYGYDYTRKEIDYFELYKKLDIDNPKLIKLYEELGQFDLAIKTRHKFTYNNKNDSYTTAHIKYPQYYNEILQHELSELVLQKELIYAVMYRESLFQRDAVSVSNAHGLMQIIPETAENISRQYSIGYEEVDDLYKPEINIKIGTKYLAWLLKKFDNTLEYVLAAYNAGPARVNRWKKKYPISNADLFIEKIEFEQTRTYVKKVLYHYYVYKILNYSYENFYYSGIKAR
jgi:hypothetical protein